jgi:hypothetical protein
MGTYGTCSPCFTYKIWWFHGKICFIMLNGGKSLGKSIKNKILAFFWRGMVASFPPKNWMTWGGWFMALGLPHYSSWVYRSKQVCTWLCQWESLLYFPTQISSRRFIFSNMGNPMPSFPH